MLTLRDIAKDAEELHQRKGWAAKSPEARFLFLAAEVGELAASLAPLAEVNGEPQERQEELRAVVGAELYDVIWNTCDLARILGIDLDSAAASKRAFNRTREW